jgi:hypothetical protein
MKVVGSQNSLMEKCPSKKSALRFHFSLPNGAEIHFTEIGCELDFVCTASTILPICRPSPRDVVFQTVKLLHITYGLPKRDELSKLSLPREW